MPGPSAGTHRRNGTVLGRFKNALSPLRHEEKRRERLMAAIESGNDTEALRLINETGLTPNDFNKDPEKFPFMTAAIRKNNLRIILELGSKGVSYNAANKDGDTALHIASFYGNADVVAGVKTSMNLNAANKDGDTALHIACRQGHLEVVHYLLEDPRTNLNLANNEGNTPLILAKESGNVHDVDIVDLLLDSGAGGVEDKLDRRILPRDVNENHNEDPITLDKIEKGQQYIMINDDPNPYLTDTIRRLLLEKPNPRSPITREPIKLIRKYIRGGKKITRKYRKSKKKRYSARKFKKVEDK